MLTKYTSRDQFASAYFNTKVHNYGRNLLLQNIAPPIFSCRPEPLGEGKAIGSEIACMPVAKRGGILVFREPASTVIDMGSEIVSMI
jgi:hypothetical protein